MPTPQISLVLGGARSGKSGRALEIAERRGEKRIFVATAEAMDEEMAARIAYHRSERGAGWRTVEAPLDLCEPIDQLAAPDAVLVIDCLTLWLNNLMHYGRDVDGETERLAASLQTAGGELVLVSNEVGLGLVPETPAGRAFRDAQGRLNQRIAAIANHVEFMAAGLPLTLKG